MPNETYLARYGKEYYGDRDLAAQHDPAGPNLARRKKWMKKVGARETSRNGWWLGKQFGLDGPPRGPQWYGHGSWFDHLGAFLVGPREYVLTSQPYAVTHADFREMQAFAEEKGLEVTISVADAWWFPGHTPLIVWKKK